MNTENLHVGDCSPEFESATEALSKVPCGLLWASVTSAPVYGIQMPLSGMNPCLCGACFACLDVCPSKIWTFLANVGFDWCKAFCTICWITHSVSPLSGGGVRFLALFSLPLRKWEGGAI